jgi:hypothetical protein
VVKSLHANDCNTKKKCRQVKIKSLPIPFCGAAACYTHEMHLSLFHKKETIRTGLTLRSR